MRSSALTAVAAAGFLVALTGAPAFASEISQAAPASQATVEQSSPSTGHLAVTGAVGVASVLLIAGVGATVAVRKQRHREL